MPYDPERHHRRSIRLQGYDYAQGGWYFVTIVAHGAECSFGEVVDDEMVLSPSGAIVQDAWFDLPRHYPHAELDQFVVMPNHVHGIIVLTDGQGTGMDGPHPQAIEARLRSAPANASAHTDGSTAGPIDSEMAVHRDVGAGFQPALARAPARRDLRADPRTPTNRHGLPEVVRAFKTYSARRINEHLGIRGVPVWQRNYYERIIRDERALDAIRQYIEANPRNWDRDAENPINRPANPPVAGMRGPPSPIPDRNRTGASRGRGLKNDDRDRSRR